jgi:hypothetical protein
MKGEKIEVAALPYTASMSMDRQPMLNATRFEFHFRIPLRPLR